MDSWIGGTNGHGTGIVRVVGNFAFVGGMSEGLIILDVSDPMNLTLVSQIIPPIDFPHTSNTPETVTARGMAIKDSLVYLCYDAGGMRVIDISDINNPVQISQFSNPILNDTGPPFYWNVPRAYNNVVLKDSLAYCAVDYCGIEIWNISDPTNAALITHWNPHDCPTGQWSESPIHTNEIAAQFECDLLFISTGSSDLMVLNIADPYNPAVADSFGTELDNIGSWGVDITDEFIYLTYIWTIVPFISNQPGIKKISYDKCSNSLGVVVEDNAVIYPNPTSDKIKVKGFPNQGHYILSNLNGMIISEGILGGGIDVVGINSGVYLLNIKFQDKSKTLKVIIK